MEIEQLIGLTPTVIKVIDDDRIRMEFSNGASCRFYHEQDCCESVVIEDVSGNWDDLIGHPLLVADERESESGSDLKPLDDSATWTFYTFRGVGGSVDVRWHGASNGYYSETVNFAFKQGAEVWTP